LNEYFDVTFLDTKNSLGKRPLDIAIQSSNAISLAKIMNRMWLVEKGKRLTGEHDCRDNEIHDLIQFERNEVGKNIMFIRFPSGSCLSFESAKGQLKILGETDFINIDVEDPWTLNFHMYTCLLQTGRMPWSDDIQIKDPLTNVAFESFHEFMIQYIGCLNEYSITSV